MLNHKKNQSGFTLVEMMIAIGILAILAAIAYPSYMQYIQRARMESARAEMADNIRMMEQHYAKYRTMCKVDTDGDDNITKTYKDASGTCTAMPDYIENAAADLYDTTIISDPMSNNASSYLVTSIPNDKAKYSENSLNNKQLYMLYYSNGSGFVKCTKSGYENVKTQTSSNADSNGCSIM